ncbi:putative transporter [Dactylonectria macrodidyma]|uniref:Transporter n=1 Tax=Dactylonectria macrodidyma TaxID=307937 RepID=A0A9P9DHG6_9HYPO|nr:putative transporter [Dactylonectria macrodidyma]
MKTRRAQLDIILRVPSNNIISTFILGAFIASLVTGFFSTFLDHKRGLIQAGTRSKGLLYFSRLRLGFSNGFYITISNSCIAEVAPAYMRGLLIALYAYWVNIGQILGSVVVNYTKDRMGKYSYQIPIACLCIVPLLLSAGLFFVPEFPRWLLAASKNIMEVLRTHSVAPECLNSEWMEIITGIDEEKSLSKNVEELEMFRGANLQRTLPCYGVIGSMNFSGCWFIIAFQTYFFAIAGISKSFRFTIVNTCLGLLGVVLWDAMGNEVGDAIVAFVAFYMFFYNGCLKSTSYTLATELVSSRLRVWTVGTATSFGCGPKYDYIWAGLNFIYVLFYYFFVPETRDWSLEELDELFEKRVGVKGFQTYQTTVGNEAFGNIRAKLGPSSRIGHKGGRIRVYLQLG